MSASRRAVLSSIAFPWLGQRLAAAITDETAYWRIVREQFSLEPGLIYLNAANLCPASRPVLDKEWQYRREIHANPSFQGREQFEGLRQRLRERLAALLHGQPTEFAIVRNASEANNVIAHGVPLKAGDEVILTTHNHPSNRASWKDRANREGFIVKEVPVPIPAKSSTELAQSILSAVTPKTRVVAFSHLTNTTGNLYPVTEIATACRPKGIWVHVDGAQSFGLLDVNLSTLGCDSFGGSAHKWPMGPLEAGLLWVRADRVSTLNPSVLSVAYYGKHPLEALGQRDDPKLVAFEAAVDFLLTLNMAQVEARSRLLSQRLMNRLAQLPGAQLKTPQDAAISASVVKFNWRGANLAKAYDLLWQRNRIACAVTPGGDEAGLRFSPHIYNSMAEIDQSVEAVRSVVTG